MDGKFILIIFVVSIIFATLGVITGKVLGEVFPKYDTSKGKPVIYVESMLQIGTIVVITYGIRTLCKMVINKFFKTEKYGEIEKFAILVAAPTVFLLQKDLKEKLAFLLN